MLPILLFIYSFCFLFNLFLMPVIILSVYLLNDVKFSKTT